MTRRVTVTDPNLALRKERATYFNNQRSRNEWNS